MPLSRHHFFVHFRVCAWIIGLDHWRDRPHKYGYEWTLNCNYFLSLYLANMVDIGKRSLTVETVSSGLNSFDALKKIFKNLYFRDASNTLINAKISTGYLYIRISLDDTVRAAHFMEYLQGWVSPHLTLCVKRICGYFQIPFNNISRRLSVAPLFPCNAYCNSGERRLHDYIAMCTLSPSMRGPTYSSFYTIKALVRPLVVLWHSDFWCVLPRPQLSNISSDHLSGYFSNGSFTVNRH